MKIDELLNRYFEGETSCEEERELRHFFTQNAEQIPEHLQAYRPLFAYLEQEAATTTAPGPEERPKEQLAAHFSRLYRLYYTVGSIAAGLLLLLGVAKILFPLSAAPENYVIIDGKRYTDEKLAKAKAQEAMQIAGFTDEYLDGLLFGN